MKVSKKQLEEIAENWYQRTYRLKAVWQNELLSIEYREKALALWKVSMLRVLAAQRLLLHCQQHTQNKFPPGGVFAEGNDEFLIPKQPTSEIPI